jgi:predicted nuclease with TOPRIM domain
VSASFKPPRSGRSNESRDSSLKKTLRVPIFLKSRNALIRERDALQAAIAAKAAELADKQASPEHVQSQLLPLTTKMQHIKRAIRDKTPRSDLKQRLEQLRKEIKELPSVEYSDLRRLPLKEAASKVRVWNQRTVIESEIMEIDAYLKFSHRNGLLTRKSVLIFLTVIVALVVLLVDVAWR